MSATGELDNRVADLNLESLIQQAAEHHGHTSKAPGNMTPGNMTPGNMTPGNMTPGNMAPELPPSIAVVKNVTAEEFLKAMNKMPLFMTELDEQGMDGGDNIDLEALRALAYEGEPDEVAQNFRTQGNENFKVKQWKDAVEFYTKALTVKCGVTEIDSACYTNRAACNLELKNYRRVINDCKAALQYNHRNVKAWYRSARALFALEKLSEAMQCIDNGLECDPSNSALLALQDQISKKQGRIAELERLRKEKEDKKKREEQILKIAMIARKIPTKTTSQPPELEDATLYLADPLDPKSTLHFPTVFLYPLTLQSDFIKAFPENSNLFEQLAMVLAEPCSWDKSREYFPQIKVEAYMETKTGGLIKIGKKMPLFEVLSAGKTQVVDQVLTILLVPKARTQEFIDDWKKKHPTPAA